MKNFLKLVCFALLSLSLHAQTIINQEYVQQWQAQPASPGLPVFNNCYLYLDQTTHLLIGINSDGSYCLAPNGSGGGIAPGTPYQVTRYDANGTNIEDSTGSDNPANGPTRWVQGLSVENNAGYRAFTNSPNGTSLNQLVCLDPSVVTMAQVMTCAVSSTSVFGIADNGAGATGTVRVAMFGFHSCVFDNQTVVGDWVIPSTSVAGDCSDAGATKPTGSQVLGHATTLNTGAGTLGTVDLFTGDTIAPGGGGNPVTVNPCIQVGCDAYYVMTNVIGGDPNTNDDGNGNKQSKSVGLTDSSQSGFWYEQAGPALPSLDGTNRFYFSIGTGFGTTYGLQAFDNAPTAGDCLDLAAGDSAGWLKLHDSGSPCGGGGGGGSVTSLTATSPIVATPSPITTTGVFSCPTCLTGVSTGNLSPLFTASFSASTTPVLSFTLSNAVANTVFGNFTNSTGAPSYNAVSACGDSTHALKWTAGTGFGCQLISVGTTTEVEVNGVDTTAQTPISFNDSTTVTFTNPSAGIIQAAIVPSPQATNPTAPTLSTNNTAGTTSYSYKIVGCEDGPTCAYHSAATSATTIATGNATLTSSNSINLTTYANTLYGYRCYNVYRTASAGTPSSTGLIGTCIWKQFIDTGLAGDSSTPPTTNTTVLDANGLTNPLPGCNKLPGAPYGIDGPPCAPVIENDEFTWGNGTFLPGDVNDPQWAWVNQNSCTVTLTNGMMSMTCPAHAATNINCLLTPVPGSTPYTFVGTFSPNSIMSNSNSNDFEAMAFYEQSSGKLYLLGHNDAGVIATETALYKMTSTTAFSATAVSGGVPYANYIYGKLQNDGTNLKFSMSPDGIIYTQMFSEAKATFFTTAPSHIGFCLDSLGAVGIDIDYFRRTQ